MSKNDDLLKLDRQLCFPLYVCSKEIVKRYKPFLDAIDLTYTQYITMMAMWEHKKLSVKELGAYLFLDSGTLTPVLKTLEKKGFVSRARSHEDERAMVITLTESGDTLKAKAAKVPIQMASCLSVISEDDAATLYRILHDMMEKL